MPKMTDRDRIADLEERQRKLVAELVDARRAVRGRYAAMVPDLPVEILTEKEFREILQHVTRAGAAASLAALKPLPAFGATS